MIGMMHNAMLSFYGRSAVFSYASLTLFCRMDQRRPCVHLLAVASGRGSKQTKLKKEKTAKVKGQEAEAPPPHKVHGSGKWSLFQLEAKDSEEADIQCSSDQPDVRPTHLPSPSSPTPPLPPLISLRDYQAEAIRKVMEAFEDGGINRQLVHMATGAGKTVTFCSLARSLNEKWTSEGRRDSRVLVLVHREELLHQTVATFKRIWPDADVGVVKGKTDEFRAKHVVVATTQTASGDARLERLCAVDDAGGFGLCIIDEAHHAPARSYQVVLEALNFHKRESKKLLIGVTATPFRQGKKLLLSDAFDHTTFEMPVFKLIEMGMLAKIKAQRIMTEVELDSDIDSDDDFSTKELEVLINSPERNALVAKSYKDLGEERKAIAFCVSIKHAQDVARAFRDIGIPAESLHSKLPKEDRARILAAHKSGEIRVLTNVSILTEGYDDTAIACVLMTRPTKSPGLYAQCIGRGLRLHPGKQDCLILDFTDRDHVLDRPSDTISVFDLVPELLPPLPPNLERKPIDEWTMDFTRITEELDLQSKLELPWIYEEQLGAYFCEFSKRSFGKDGGIVWKKAHVRVKCDIRGRWQTYYHTVSGSSWKEEDWISLGQPVSKIRGEDALLVIEAKGLVKMIRQEIGFSHFSVGIKPASPAQLQALIQRGVTLGPETTSREAGQAFLKLLVLEKSGLSMKTIDKESVEFIPATMPQINYLRNLMKKVLNVSGEFASYVAGLEAKIDSGLLDKLDAAYHIQKLIDIL